MNREEIIAYLKQFKKKNMKKYHIERLGIFGSVARNMSKSNSDLDIVVKLSRQDLFDIIGIKQDLEEKLHYPVDVVSYRERMNSFLKKHIDEEVIYV